MKSPSRSRLTRKRKPPEPHWVIQHGRWLRYASYSLFDGWTWTALRKEAYKFESYGEAQEIQEQHYREPHIMIERYEP